MMPLPEHTPPRWIRKLLSMFLDPRMLEASLGDLEEKFQRCVRNNIPPWQAKLFYIIEGIGFLKMARRRKHASTQTTINMISHTLLFFSRLVRKDKSYYLVSLLGLTISLASFLLIMMFINDELRYDQFHEKSDRIYRVTTHLQLNDVIYGEASSQFPAAAALRQEISEVEEAIRLYPQDRFIEVGDKKFAEHILFADENLFKVFSFPLIRGNRNTVMKEPSGIILTRSTAKKYFAAENPLSKTLVLDGQTLVVSGVIEDVPEQSHIKFSAIMPLSFQLAIWKHFTGIEGRENKWFWTGAYTYLLLKNAADEEAVRARLPLVVDKYFPARYKEKGGFRLQPLTDIHLRSNLSAEFEPGGSILYLRLFSVVAFVIMIVSAINLINLSYFKINSRIREMGIRKFLGQNTSRIIAQLSIESTLTGVLAFLLAILVCQLSLQSFNILVQKNLRLWSQPNVMIAGVSFLLIILICAVAVLRPATRYATQSSSYLLLRNYGHPGMKSRVRNVLIGLQVCFSFVLLVFSFIISSQIDFFKHKDLGFDKENIVTLELNEGLYNNLEAFRNELKKDKDVVDVAGGPVPGTGCDAWRFVPEGGSYERPLMLPFTTVDYNFLSTLNIKLVLGRSFKPDGQYDSLMPLLINKRAAVELGWLDDPLHKTLEVFAAGTTEIMAKGIVIGVIEDYHFESLHRPVKPIVLTTGPYYGTLLIKTTGADHQHTIARIGDAWKKFSDAPFQYGMLDKTLERLYDNETQLSNVILFFTFIALYLTCYGLFAMSSLLFSSRLKEVAIRKIFGADQFAIIRQLYSRYAIFNLAAIVVGLPVAIWLGDLWLQTFQYRITLESSLFIKAGVCILIAGLLSVSYYLARVAFSNPVKFLRRE